MNLAAFCFWTDRAVLGSTENSAIWLKNPSFENYISYVSMGEKREKLEFLHIVAFTLES